MADQKDNVKKWLDRDDRVKSESENNIFNQQTNLNKVITSFCDILYKIEADFRAKHEGETSVKITYLDEEKNKMRTTRILRSDPTKHEVVDANHLVKARSALRVAADIAQYPQLVHNLFLESCSENIAKNTAPKVEQAAIKGLHYAKHGLFDNIARSLIKNDTLNFRNDYEGLHALKNFDKQIESIIAQEQIKTR